MGVKMIWKYLFAKRKAEVCELQSVLTKETFCQNIKEIFSVLRKRNCLKRFTEQILPLDRICSTSNMEVESIGELNDGGLWRCFFPLRFLITVSMLQKKFLDVEGLSTTRERGLT